MKRPHRLRLFVPLLILGSEFGAAGVLAADDPPALKEPVEMLATREERSAAALPEKSPPHEALDSPARNREPEYIDKVPPPPIAERPGEGAPKPDARWIEGYWDWDKVRKDFVWVTGAWRVPPAGKFWVNGYWRRHEKGWFRVPGFWNERKTVRTSVTGEGTARDWHTTGPPSERPAEVIHPAPGPDYFYVPGEYVPEGDRVVWRAGFWSPVQLGWEWMPARWVRQATGWVFRDGSWKRVVEAPVPPPGNGPPFRSTTIVSTPANSSSTADLTSTTLSPLGAAEGTSLNSDLTAGSTSPNGINGENPSGSSPTPGDGNPDPATGETPGDTTQPKKPANSAPVRAAAPQPSPYGYGPRPMYSPGSMLRARVYGALGRFLPY